MKVMRLTAQNVMGVEEIDWDFEGHSLWLIGGRNGQGKTSALRALVMALAGRSGMDGWPELPLREGEREGSIKVELTGSQELQEEQQLTAELRFLRRRSGAIQETFRLYDSAGEDAPEPRTLLKRLFKTRGFDPLAFERAKPKEQRKILLEAMGVDLDSITEHRSVIYAERTEANRRYREIEAKLKVMERPKDAPSKLVDTSKLAERLRAAQENNRALKKAEDRVAKLDVEIDGYIQQIKALEKKISDAKVVREEAFVESRKLEMIDESAIVDEISAATEQNAKFGKLEAFKAVAKQADEAKAQADVLTQGLETIDQEQKAFLEQAKWPLPGMSVDDDCVLVDGIPFAQCSQSQRIRASLQIGMWLNPELRLLVCEDGSALDSDSLQEIEQYAKANDYLVLVEVVTRTPGDEGLCQVVIEDGREKGTDDRENYATDGDEGDEVAAGLSGQVSAAEQDGPDQA